MMGYVIAVSGSHKKQLKILEQEFGAGINLGDGEDGIITFRE